jgi:2-C-methyl-D-erythritol 2,4-cyclodiphosphate synthase
MIPRGGHHDDAASDDGSGMTLLAAFVLGVAQAAATPAPTPVAAPPATAAPAPAPADRRSVLRTLVVAPGETVASALCVGCGIVVRGRVLGDSIAILGGVEVLGESGTGGADDVLAIGGAVHLGPSAKAPASLVSLGGPVQIDPGAAASYDVDSLPWLHLPGQRRVFAEGAVCLAGFVLSVVLAGAALVRARGIAARDAALRRAPLARGLLGFALVSAYGCLMVNGEGLGRFEDVLQAAAGLGLLAAGVPGSTGVASVLGSGLARLAGQRLHAGWRSAALGAVALGDLGGLHPADARTPRGIASTELVRDVCRRLAEAGWRPASVDVTVVAARPRLGDHLDGMAKAIASMLGIDRSAVNVKASTGNLDGDDGAGRSISAVAIAMVSRLR